MAMSILSVFVDIVPLRLVLIFFPDIRGHRSDNPAKLCTVFLSLPLIELFVKSFGRMVAQHMFQSGSIKPLNLSTNLLELKVFI